MYNNLDHAANLALFPLPGRPEDVAKTVGVRSEHDSLVAEPSGHLLVWGGFKEG